MDERFAEFFTNPKFRRMKKQDRKIKVDERFQSLVKSTKSHSGCKIDKRGRPLKTAKNDFRQFYDLSDSENEKDKASKRDGGKQRIKKTKIKEDKRQKINRKKISNEDVEDSDEEKETSGEDEIDQEKDESEEEEAEESEEEEAEESEAEESEEEEEEEEEADTSEEEDDSDGKEYKSEEEDEEIQEKCSKEEGTGVKKSKKKKKKERLPDYSRGIGNLSSSDDEEEEEEEKSDYYDDSESKDGITKGLTSTIHPWADQLEPEIPVVDESSRRLAICNMNWDYISAQDLMLLCNSFKPQHGTVISVTIYPTDFGLERMKGETVNGPKEIIESTEEMTKSSLKAKNQKNKAVDAERLRQYELNRLRYFVAVVECDSVETADHIYKSCDGMEFEKTGTKLDFRYIPDDVTFDHEPQSVASSLPAGGTYKPPHFVDSALSKTDVKLSWDKTSHRRLAVTQIDLRKLKDVDEMEEQMKEYLAPYTSEEEGDDEKDDDADPYAGLDWSYVPEYVPEKKDVDEMKRLLLEPEVNDAKDDDDIDMEITWEIGLKDELEEAAKEKQKQMTLDKMTPFEQYKQKRKEKRRQKEREKRQTKRNNEKETSIVNDGMDLETFFVGEDEDEQSDIRKESSSGKTKQQENSKKIKSKDSLKKRAKKRKREMAEQQLEVDKAILSDPRFAELASKDFAVDPSAPEFHKRRRKL